jgi:Nif-specific regulatory protein
VGKSDAVGQVYEAIKRVSHSQATVLLRGESGTGKELVARAIHLESPRASGPFVRLHCAALTETLLESELFGHERGAFTGAVEMRKGRFELADGGTLFLDEIGDIPPAIQVKLLRVIQDKCFERVGGNRLLSVDVRVISATHRDLEAMVLAGTFREDLYYRLNVVPVTLPPLRERSGDILLLIEHFLARFNRENRREVCLGRDLLGLMARYHWPGNVRELQNCVERLVVMAEPGHELVTLETVPSSLRGYFADMRQVTGAESAGTAKERTEKQPLGESLQQLERRRVREALERTGWVQARAARALGITPRQVAYKMRKYGISDVERGSH